MRIEYASVVYGPMLTASQSATIERLQAVAMRTIWGWEKKYDDCLELSGLARLDERRARALESFARKTQQNPRYEHWFPTNNNHAYDLRHREALQIKFAKHERLKKTPIYAMRRILNGDTTTITRGDEEDLDD